MVEEKGNIADLEAKVVHAGLCCYCGACGAFCREYITYEDEKPTTKEKCYEYHGACYDFCPRTFFAPFDVERAIFGEVRKDSVLGYYREILTARAKDPEIQKRAQDGGVVSALLTYMLESGKIEAAAVARRAEGDAWKPEPFVATSKDDVLAAAGSKYTQCPVLLAVGDALLDGKKSVALVGLPCHVQAMRKIQLSESFDVGADRVTMVIGLFCMETFDMEALKQKLAEIDVKIEDVEKFNIKKGKFLITVKGEEKSIPIKDMKTAMRPACRVCYDFAAEFADVSVGSVGAELGWNTVIVRSEKGAELVKEATEKGYLEAQPLSEEGVNAVKTLASRKKKENLKNIEAQAGKLKLLNMLVEPELLPLLLLE